MEVVVTTGAIKHAKLQSNRHHQQTNTQCFRQQEIYWESPLSYFPSCHPTNSIKALKFMLM